MPIAQLYTNDDTGECNAVIKTWAIICRLWVDSYKNKHYNLVRGGDSGRGRQSMSLMKPLRKTPDASM
ncbi:MAG: hypothetical protein Q9218_002405 [Villophora microphyllina]